jgi:nucleoside diphosphate kinase
MSEIFVMIKPWGLSHKNDILTELDRHGSMQRSVTVEKIGLEEIASHYAMHADRLFFERMIKDFVGKPALLAIYEGDYAVFDKVKDELRERYQAGIPQNDTFQHRNVLHVSSSEEEYESNREVWRKHFI